MMTKLRLLQNVQEEEQQDDGDHQQHSLEVMDRKCMDTYDDEPNRTKDNTLSSVFLKFREVRKELLQRHRHTLQDVYSWQGGGEIQLWVPDDSHSNKSHSQAIVVPPSNGLVEKSLDHSSVIIDVGNSTTRKSWRRDVSIKNICGYIDEDFVLQPTLTLPSSKLQPPAIEHTNQLAATNENGTMDISGDMFFDSIDGNPTTIMDDPWKHDEFYDSIDLPPPEDDDDDNDAQDDDDGSGGYVGSPLQHLLGTLYPEPSSDRMYEDIDPTPASPSLKLTPNNTNLPSHHLVTDYPQSPKGEIADPSRKEFHSPDQNHETFAVNQSLDTELFLRTAHNAEQEDSESDLELEPSTVPCTSITFEVDQSLDTETFLRTTHTAGQEDSEPCLELDPRTVPYTSIEESSQNHEPEQESTLKVAPYSNITSPTSDKETSTDEISNGLGAEAEKEELATISQDITNISDLGLENGEDAEASVDSYEVWLASQGQDTGGETEGDIVSSPGALELRQDYAHIDTDPELEHSIVSGAFTPSSPNYHEPEHAPTMEAAPMDAITSPGHVTESHPREVAAREGFDVPSPASEDAELEQGTVPGAFTAPSPYHEQVNLSALEAGSVTDMTSPGNTTYAQSGEAAVSEGSSAPGLAVLDLESTSKETPDMQISHDGTLNAIVVEAEQEEPVSILEDVNASSEVAFQNVDDAEASVDSYELWLASQSQETGGETDDDIALGIGGTATGEYEDTEITATSPPTDSTGVETSPTNGCNDASANIDRADSKPSASLEIPASTSQDSYDLWLASQLDDPESEPAQSENATELNREAFNTPELDPPGDDKHIEIEEFDPPSGDVNDNPTELSREAFEESNTPEIEEISGDVNPGLTESFETARSEDASPYAVEASDGTSFKPQTETGLPNESLRRPTIPSPRHMLWDSEIQYVGDIDETQPHQMGVNTSDSNHAIKPNVPTPTQVFSGAFGQASDDEADDAEEEGDSAFRASNEPTDPLPETAEVVQPTELGKMVDSVSEKDVDAAWLSLSAQWEATHGKNRLVDPAVDIAAAVSHEDEEDAASTGGDEGESTDRQAIVHDSPVSSLTASPDAYKKEDNLGLETGQVPIPPLDDDDISDVSDQDSDVRAPYVRHRAEHTTPKRPVPPPHAKVYPDKAPVLATETRAGQRAAKPSPSTPHRIQSTKSPGMAASPSHPMVYADQGPMLATEARAKQRQLDGTPARQSKLVQPSPSRIVSRLPKTPSRPLVFPDKAPDLETASRAESRKTTPSRVPTSPAVVPSSANPFPLNDRRQDHSKVCTNPFEAHLHSGVGACDRCWTLACPADRAKFEARGTHLNIVRTRSGCGRNCKIYPRTSQDEEPFRLCRKCFYATHQQGNRMQIFRGNHQRIS